MSDSATPAASGSATCRWCGCAFSAEQLSCPACGAGSAAVPRRTEQGWVELPSIRDMARIHFGHSTCQIEGDVTPVADMNLAAADGVYFMHHAMLWRDPALATSLVTLRTGFKRLFGGMPLFMMQAHGPGRIAFSGMHAGELFAVPLHAGQAIDVREHVLLVADRSVQYDFFDPGVWYVSGSGNDQKTHYPVGLFMDRFTASDRPGLVLLHARGDVFVRDLAAGESLLVQPGSLIYKSPSVGMRLHIEEPQQGGWTAFFSSWRHRFLFLHLTGPGRVAVHSVFEQLAELGTMTSHS
jgi:uncharacterized protein (AIM24 family)